MDKKIIIYTDGAARGNPGPGGYGVVMMYGNHKKEFSKGFRKTTNNRMELLAIITALQQLKTNDIPIEIYTDSKYVVDSITKGWLATWVKTNFKGGKKNKDLWMKYYTLSHPFKIKFHWVKGHAENPYNNRCDQLATKAADEDDLDIDYEYEGMLAENG